MTPPKGFFLIDVVIRVIIFHQWTVHPVAPSSVPLAESVVPILVALGDVKMVESSHPLLCWVAIGLKRPRLERWHITVFLESADVELRHSSPLLNEAGVRSVSYRLAKKVVPKLGKLWAWRVLARSVRRRRLHLLEVALPVSGFAAISYATRAIWMVE
jgi:hypothetical protein